MVDFSVLNTAVEQTFAEVVHWIDAFDRATSGIFDSRHVEIETEGQGVVSELVTTLGVKADEAEPIKTGERCEVRGVLYRIVDRRPDGQGMIVLLLERA
ncbi:MAG TPA: hypothetical protein VGB88_06230 [Alphaproteobacteria bacterium]